MDELKLVCHVKEATAVKVREQLDKVLRENNELAKATQMIEDRQAPLFYKYDREVNRYAEVAKQMKQERKHHQRREQSLSSEIKKLNDEKSEEDLKLSKLQHQNTNLLSTLFHEHSTKSVSKLNTALKGKKTYKKEVRQLRQSLRHYTELLEEKEIEIKTDASDMAMMAKSLEEQRQDVAEAKEEAAAMIQSIHGRLHDVSNDKDELEKENKILHEENKLLGKESYM